MDTVSNNTVLTCSLELPKHYRADDILAFHNRDVLAVAESVDGHSLRKGLLWNHQAACLTIRFNNNSADVELAIDGLATTNDADALFNLVRRMLGLTQQVEDFEQSYRQHPQLGMLIAQQPGLRVPTSATVFEALSWAITGQQISVSAAISIRRKLIQAAGVMHSSGLACYPDAKQLALLSESDLRQAGFSQTKAQTLLVVSRMIEIEELSLENVIGTSNIEEIRRQLLQIRGIGPWTVNYALLRGFGWLDGSLHGDVAVRHGLQALLGNADKMTEQQAQQWLMPFSPWRALVAAHLWAFSIRQARVRRCNSTARNRA
ncbi:MAG: DNA-3-methyladenine glycosylase 2 family protein [Methylobacter sp.]|nr:MAG: DNA-3-methyladenine glycosylase 2 family protein [Methylobacter sp.]